ncbi:hypothetical protein LTR66_016857, partial [Elasticomyces elasticus]
MAHQVEHHDPAQLERFLRGIASAFYDTALSRAFISEIDDLQPPYPNPGFNVDRIYRHVAQGITEGAQHGAELVEAGDYSALAVWETTAYKGIPFAETMVNVGPVREEWREHVNRMKKTYVGTIEVNGKKEFRPFYHLGFLVRNPDVSSVKGAIG